VSVTVCSLGLILFPVANPKLVRRLKDILNVQLADERKSHHLQSDGRYIRSKKSESPDAIDSQQELLTLARSSVTVSKGPAVLSRKHSDADRRGRARPKA
jgi:hypothetical protein